MLCVGWSDTVTMLQPQPSGQARANVLNSQDRLMDPTFQRLLSNESHAALLRDTRYGELHSRLYHPSEFDRNCAWLTYQPGAGIGRRVSSYRAYRVGFSNRRSCPEML